MPYNSNFGKPVPEVGVGRYLEITAPTATQREFVDSLFELAAEKRIFPHRSNNHDSSSMASQLCEYS